MKTKSTTPKTPRSAHAAIAGYEYQFDNTALRLLSATASDVVEIEGTEDIDIYEPNKTTAVQVKYFAGQDYKSPKTLRKPVKLMLEHYKQGGNWDYNLYIYFNNFNNMPRRFTVEQVKYCLTHKTKQEGVKKYYTAVSESELIRFTCRLKLIPGDDFETQQTNLIQALCGAMRCDGDEVEAIYLAKTREFIHERARHGEASIRTVKKQDLLDRLNVKDFLFDKWQIQKIGEDRYIAAQKKNLRSGSYHDPARTRAIYLNVSQDNYREIVEICKTLASKLRTRLKNAQPWTVIVDGRTDLVHRLKVELVRSGIQFNDGYENIEFQPQIFIEPPVYNTKGTGDAISRASFALRLVTREHFLSIEFANFKISRFISIGDKQDWMNEVSEQVFALRHFEPNVYRQLMEAIA